MRIKVIGESDCARAVRGLLRKAGFAVSEYLPREAVLEMPSGGYVVAIEEHEADQIHFDSVDCELEANIVRHVTALSAMPVLIDRPGGQVHSDCEIRILAPAHLPEQQMAVEFGVLRGLLDTVGYARREKEQAPQPPRPSFWKRVFGGKK